MKDRMNRRQFMKTGVAGTASLGVPELPFGRGLPQTRSAMESSSPVKASLNGLELIFDGETGSLLEMSYPGPGKMLDTSPGRASLVDLAYPVPEFEPLRLASRFSKSAKIQASSKEVVIRYENLGASREVKRLGSVSTTVRFAADADGRSVMMTCEIDNRSNKPVRQVIFPDMFGIVPFAGEDSTVFRTGGFGMQPFKELKVSEHDVPWYSVTPKIREYAAGPYDPPRMTLRWMDLGSLAGGFSLFQKRWWWNPEEDPEYEMHREHVMLDLSEIDNKLRLMCLHKVGIEPQQQWKSKEYVLTPHRYGWAEGIEPFRQWVKHNWKREYPLPKHIREGLGFRSILMSEQYGNYPLSRSETFKFTDLPGIAREAKEHGLDEMVVWNWYWSFQSPIPPPYTVIGTEKEMAENTAACKRIGVNVQYEFTCMQLSSPSAESYGLSPSPAGSWTYHTEFIPRHNPDYGVARWSVFIKDNDRRWQADILNSCKHLVDIGCGSFCWDQYGGDPSMKPNLYTLTSEIRAYAKQRDPDSTFSGEPVELERDAIYLDYTWMMGNYKDYRPYTSVMDAPRLNPNVDRSARDVKLNFMDNLYMNIMPSKPDGPNGSAMIADYPEVSRALKQCAGLRKQFLPYFLEGKLIGECILSEPCPGSHVTAYVRPDRGLMILMNCDLEHWVPSASGPYVEGQDGQRSFRFSCDLAHWIPSASGSYEIKSFNMDGKLVRTERVQKAIWKSETGALEKYSLVLYEILPG
jgi:hypothetical protein